MRRVQFDILSGSPKKLAEQILHFLEGDDPEAAVRFLAQLPWEDIDPLDLHSALYTLVARRLFEKGSSIAVGELALRLPIQQPTPVKLLGAVVAAVEVATGGAHSPRKAKDVALNAEPMTIPGQLSLPFADSTSTTKQSEPASANVTEKEKVARQNGAEGNPGGITGVAPQPSSTFAIAKEQDRGEQPASESGTGSIQNTRLEDGAYGSADLVVPLSEPKSEAASIVGRAPSSTENAVERPASDQATLQFTDTTQTPSADNEAPSTTNLSPAATKTKQYSSKTNEAVATETDKHNKLREKQVYPHTNNDDKNPSSAPQQAIVGGGRNYIAKVPMSPARAVVWYPAIRQALRDIEPGLAEKLRVSAMIGGADGRPEIIFKDDPDLSHGEKELLGALFGRYSVRIIGQKQGKNAKGGDPIKERNEFVSLLKQEGWVVLEDD